jgi:hypothetical protein
MSDAEPGATLTEVQQKLQQKEPPLVERAYETRAEMKVRHIELKAISERLDHVAAVSRAKKWEIRSQVTFGVVAGGVVALIPFLAAKPSLVLVVCYVAVLIVATGVSRLCWTAGTDIAGERTDSVLAIKEHIDKTMLKTETPRLQAPTDIRRLEAPVEPPLRDPEPPLPPPD